MAREVFGVLPVCPGNKVVLVSNSKGHFLFPKGGVEHDETGAEAAQREAFEEAGIKGATGTEPFITIRGIGYYVMYVETLSDSFPESKIRIRTISTPSDVLANSLVPEYVKEIVRLAIGHGLLNN